MTRRAVAAAALLILAACDEMDQQPRYDSYEASSLFANGSSLQTPPDGTIARNAGEMARQEERPAMTRALLDRGHERYGIYCAPCHDPAGYGGGIIPARGFPHPPSYHQDRLRAATDLYLLDVIEHGHGVMYAYGSSIPPADRWAIVAYIRALQLSQNAPDTLLSPRDHAALERGS